jgi:hypothetical protein
MNDRAMSDREQAEQAVEMPAGNAGMIAVASLLYPESMRVAEAPLLASSCRCDAPLWVRDVVLELHAVETRCRKCGRRPSRVAATK